MMELLAQVPLIGGFLSWAIPFLIVLSVVVFVHEFGHYIVGRWCGIRAEVFSIGFGRPLVHWTDGRGTRWQIAALPLGGFVRFVGDMDPASAGRADEAALTPEERKVAFHNAALLGRALTVTAGPAANFLLSIIVFMLLALAVGKHSDEPVIGALGTEAAADIGLKPGDRVLSVGGQKVEDFGDIIKYLADGGQELQPATVERNGGEIAVVIHYRGSPQITDVRAGQPAARAGLLPGDIILTVDGKPMRTFRELQIATAEKRHGEEISVGVERGGKQLDFRFVPEIQLREHPVTHEMLPIPTMGISLAVLNEIQPKLVSISFLEAAQTGFLNTWGIITNTLIYVGDMIFHGADTSQLGGPITIAKVSGDAAEEGFSSLVFLIALLSTSIGLINLFPIPILDGGHLMFYALEWLRGRPVGETSMKVGTVIGLSLVVLLMVFATYNDLVRLL